MSHIIIIGPPKSHKTLLARYLLAADVTAIRISVTDLHHHLMREEPITDIIEYIKNTTAIRFNLVVDDCNMTAASRKQWFTLPNKSAYIIDDAHYPTQWEPPSLTEGFQSIYGVCFETTYPPIVINRIETTVKPIIYLKQQQKHSKVVVHGKPSVQNNIRSGQTRI